LDFLRRVLKSKLQTHITGNSDFYFGKQVQIRITCQVLKTQKVIDSQGIIKHPYEYLPGSNAPKDIEVLFSPIISDTNKPVAGARLRPIMACPEAITRLEIFLLRPIYGSPSGVHGLNPCQIFFSSGIATFIFG
jgi:hypothetical protein